jgi:dihydroorotase-like cyclic amidohydrolase
MREDINCFDSDFFIPLVTVSVKIENLMWKWSDYKAMKDKIFFNPPIRESGQVKAMFKWINRWVIAWIYISHSPASRGELEVLDEKIENFLWHCIKEEKILSLTLWNVLNYNYLQIWFLGDKKELIINY